MRADNNLEVIGMEDGVKREFPKSGTHEIFNWKISELFCGLVDVDTYFVEQTVRI
jgi:hypothetical protein